MNVLHSTPSTENDGPTIDRESVESAGGETPSSAAAPVATTPSSHSRSYEWVFKAITPCMQPEEEATMDTQPLQHTTANSYSYPPWLRDSRASSSSSKLHFRYDYILSAPPTVAGTPTPASVETQRPPPETEGTRRNDFEGLPSGMVYGSPSSCKNRRPSAEIGCSAIGGERVESAGDKGYPSLPVAPLPPTVVMRFRPCNMVIVITPPSPPATISPSESQKYATDMGLNRDISRSPLHRPQRASLTSQANNPYPASRGPAIVANPHPVKSYSRLFRPATDQGVGSAARVRKRPVPKVVTSLAEVTKPRCSNVSITNKALLSTARPFGSPSESEDQLTFLDMIALGGRIDNLNQAVDGADVSSTADEAEPSLRVEPIHPTLPRKFARVKRSADEPTSHPVHPQARALTSRVTSTVSKWVKAVSKFVRRPERLEETTAFNPSFDPWEEGYVPPRGPSSE
ncbi:hypothetical protein FS837_010149 [Tulasnella sp. UAMH 9824]|nr:hypothetical protein FS837_010149 [Tulasnella sp. UAMH 9824]